MKAIAAIFAVACAAMSSMATYACEDEQCRREAAEKELNIEFPGYLSWSYCDDIRMDFMTSSVRSLENYQANHFDPRYKGGMRNIVTFIEQRQEWLNECDQYLTSTGKNPIFEDDATTAKVLEAMDGIKKELNDLARGVTYSRSLDQREDAVANERFDEFFQIVEDHKTLMHLKGKYVYR